MTLSGFVTEASGGRAVAGAVVYTEDLSTSASTYARGYYSLRLKNGTYQIVCSCAGYKQEKRELVLNGPQTCDFKMSEDIVALEAASVFSISRREEIARPQMGREFVDVQFARKLPAMLGEVDIVKVIQMLPGVQSPSEGSTGFSVRGGGIDQNLVLLDGAPLYNAGHFLGFFSMFNGDAVKNAELYKSDFPAHFRGRMSSVLDVSTKDGNINEWTGNFSFGLITSKAHVEGPVVKSKLGFSFSARRTCADLFFPLFKRRIPDNTKLNFWDTEDRFRDI